MRKLFLFVLLAGLAACQDAPPQPVQPVISFAGKPPIRLDVASVEVADEYVPPLRAPHVEHEFPIKIAAAAERWARERLLPVGSQRTARVIIKDASATVTELPVSSGIRGALTTDQDRRYDARVEVVVEVRSERGFRDAFASASAQRSRTVPEDFSLGQRDEVFVALTEALMTDLDAELERNIRAFMPLVVR